MALYWAVIPLFEPAPPRPAASSPQSPAYTNYGTDMAWCPPSPYADNSTRGSSPAGFDMPSPVPTDSLDMELLKVATASTPRRTLSNSSATSTTSSPYGHGSGDANSPRAGDQGWNYMSAPVTAPSSGPISPMAPAYSLPTIQEESTPSRKNLHQRRRNKRASATPPRVFP